MSVGQESGLTRHESTTQDHPLFAGNSLYSAGDAYHGDHPGCLDHPFHVILSRRLIWSARPWERTLLAAVRLSKAPLQLAPVTRDRVSAAAFGYPTAKLNALFTSTGMLNENTIID